MGLRSHPGDVVVSTDETGFVNALREVLGLGPLPFTERDDSSGIEAHMMRHAGDGNHHTGYSLNRDNYRTP
jgi:hypothetical protein